MKPLYFPTEIFFEEEVFEDLKNYSDERILIITSRPIQGWTFSRMP